MIQHEYLLQLVVILLVLLYYHNNKKNTKYFNNINYIKMEINELVNWNVKILKNVLLLLLMDIMYWIGMFYVLIVVHIDMILCIELVLLLFLFIIFCFSYFYIFVLVLLTAKHLLYRICRFIIYHQQCMQFIVFCFCICVSDLLLFVCVFI